MKRTTTLCILLLSAALLFSGCSRRYSSFWVGNNGRYVVRRHGPSVYLPWNHKHYGRHIKIKSKRRLGL